MVNLITSTTQLQVYRRDQTGACALVPTMGNLHAGHLSLLTAALEEFPTVYFTIFVNPKQFGPDEDFNRYPRTLEQDLNLIQGVVGKFPKARLVVYSPQHPQEVFPMEENQTISVAGLPGILEGAMRPGHFDGVATVVLRLFQLIRPDQAYFGLKDYQQYLVICQMIKDLQMPIKVMGMPIVREPSGLALSSRNQYLTEEQKAEALILNRSLKRVAEKLAGKRANLLSAVELIKEIIQDKNWNYLEIRDALTLDQDVSGSERVTILGVYQLGNTRLLDNLQQELS